MTDDELSDLEAKAKAATGGKWRYTEHLPYEDGAQICDMGDGWIASDEVDSAGEIPNAKFIAAANPATVLALIAEVRELRAQINDHVCEGCYMEHV